MKHSQYDDVLDRYPEQCDKPTAGNTSSEKPDIDYACSHLRIDDPGKDQFLTVFGQYALTPTIFTFPEEHIRMNLREHREFQLTSRRDTLRQEEGFMGVVVEGKRFATGLPEPYRQTVIDNRVT